MNLMIYVTTVDGAHIAKKTISFKQKKKVICFYKKKIKKIMKKSYTQPKSEKAGERANTERSFTFRE